MIKNVKTGKDVMALRQGLKNNWTLKLASVAIAFLIWLVIGNINDPVIQKVYSSIPVTITNGSYIESRGMTYRLDSGHQTVSVTLKGNTSRVTRRNDDIKVEADSDPDRRYEFNANHGSGDGQLPRYFRR